MDESSDDLVSLYIETPALSALSSVLSLSASPHPSLGDWTKTLFLSFFFLFLPSRSYRWLGLCQVYWIDLLTLFFLHNYTHTWLAHVRFYLLLTVHIPLFIPSYEDQKVHHAFHT